MRSTTPSCTVAGFLIGWLEGRQSLRPSTRQAYQSHLTSTCSPSWATCGWLDLRSHHIEAMYRRIIDANTARERPIGPTTMRRIHATLNSALNTAVRRGLIRRNPATTVDLPRPSPVASSAWTYEEVAAFLTATKDDHLAVLYRLLVLTGLRRGEAVGLRWSDLDLAGGTLTVRRQVVSVAGELIIGPPKSEAGRRTVALDQGTVELLRLRHRRDRIAHWASTDEDFDDTLVFRRSDGKGIHPAYVSRHFTTLVHPARATPDPAARPAAHLRLHRPGQRREPAGGQPAPGPLLHHHHRRHLLPRLPRHRGGVGEAAGSTHRRRHLTIGSTRLARTAPAVPGFFMPTAPLQPPSAIPLGAFPCAKEKTMTTTDPCSFPGCGDKRYAKGLCLAHYRQQRRGEPLAPVARRTAAEGCAVDGCDRPHRAGGLCTSHYPGAQNPPPRTRGTAAMSQVDDDVLAWLGTTDQHVALGGRIHRRRVVGDGAAQQPGLAAVADPGAAGPARRHVARLGELEQARDVVPPWHREAHTGEGDRRTTARLPGGRMGRRQGRAAIPGVIAAPAPNTSVCRWAGSSPGGPVPRSRPP